MSALLTRRGRFFPSLIWLLVAICLATSLLSVVQAWLPVSLLSRGSSLARLIADTPLCSTQHAVSYTSLRGSGGLNESLHQSSQQQASALVFFADDSESGDTDGPHCDACLFTFAVLHVNHYAAQAPPVTRSAELLVSSVAYLALQPRFSLPLSQAPPSFPHMV